MRGLGRDNLERLGERLGLALSAVKTSVSKLEDGAVARHCIC